MIKKRYYRIYYTLNVYGRKTFFMSNKIKAICKLHALIKFMRHYKHKKELKRQILKVEKLK